MNYLDTGPELLISTDFSKVALTTDLRELSPIFSHTGRFDNDFWWHAVVICINIHHTATHNAKLDIFLSADSWQQEALQCEIRTFTLIVNETCHKSSATGNVIWQFKGIDYANDQNSETRPSSG